MRLQNEDEEEEKKMIDIFIKQTAKGPAWQAAEGCFTLRISGRDGSAKYDSKKLQRDRTTAKIISAELLVNAIFVLDIYSRRRGLITSEPVTVHFDNNEAAVMCESRLRQWKQAGWKNKKGEALPEQYRILHEMIRKSNRTFTFTKGE